MPEAAILFEPLTVREKTFRNRIIVPHMVSVRSHTAQGGYQWYTALARGGASMVIVKATGVGDIGTRYALDGLKKLVNGIQAEGALAAIQLFPVSFRTSAVCGEAAEETLFCSHR